MIDTRQPTPDRSNDRDSARDEILSKVRDALSPRGAWMPALPPVSNFARVPGNSRAELELLLAEVGRLGGVALEVATPSLLRRALAELVETQRVERATLWTTSELRELRIGDILDGCGVQIVSPHAGKHQLAECDLGVTGVDAALPETGTLLLRSSPDRPRLVSLLPRVHLAILSASALKVDLGQALEKVRGESLICITGPSRTADIEMSLTLGVHGPRVLCVWAIGADFRAD